MPAAGLYLRALARGDQKLIRGGNIEFPDMCDLAQPCLAGRRVHRGGLNVKIADIVSTAIAIQHARAAISGRSVEENINRFETAKSCPDPRVRRNATAAALVDERAMFGVLHDSFERIGHWQDETVMHDNLVGDIGVILFDLEVVDRGVLFRRLYFAHAIETAAYHPDIVSRAEDDRPRTRIRIRRHVFGD